MQRHMHWYSIGREPTKRCPQCLNIVSKHCKLVRGPTGSTIPVYTTDTSRFRMMSDKTFRSMQARLKDIALHHPGELKVKQQDFGFKWNPCSWLQDNGLNVQAKKGVWELEFCACMDELSRHGHGGRQLHPYLQCFTWPQAYASGRDVCNGVCP